MKTIYVVEAALFSAGRALSVDEISERTSLGKGVITKACEELRKVYAERESILEVGKAGTKWSMQVRKQGAEPAAKFAAMEIAPKLLKTLALIAYHQPMKQSELCDMVGSRVYDHVPELKERGLIKTRKEGQTKIITTTALFPEYFGLDAATPEQIRMALAKAVGLDPAAEAKKARGLEGFDEAKTQTASAVEAAVAAASEDGDESEGESKVPVQDVAPPAPAVDVSDFAEAEERFVADDESRESPAEEQLIETQ